MIRRALIADKTIVESSRVSYPSLPQFEVLQANTFVAGVLEYYISQLGTYVSYIPTTKVGAVLGLKQSTLGTGVSNDWMYFDLFYVVGPNGEKYPEPGSFYINGSGIFRLRKALCSQSICFLPLHNFTDSELSCKVIDAL